MAAFWAGVVSALIGAVVGGIFTAIGVRTQVKAALQAAEIQVSAMADQQVEKVRIEAERRAVAEVTRTLGDVLLEAFKIEDSHFFTHHDKEPDSKCPEPDAAIIRQANQWRQKFDHTQIVYGPYLSPGANERLDSIFELVPFGNNWYRLLKKHSGKTCPVGAWLEELSSALMHVIKDIPLEMGIQRGGRGT
ncbi:hypothetical protein [Dactylosporangium sp. NPDC049140]|uniref:hypothetical protein n=1 Tax=Dactylosporangium sp. NPDC049140 TaxID=3155647 RepID=UPI0033D8B748